MSEIAKHLEKAEKHLQKGKLSSALDEFREVLREDPNHEAALQRAAEICISLELTAEAGGYLAEVFDRAAGTNRASEAVAAYRKLAKITPPSEERTFKYGQLLERSNPREAMEAYKSVYDSYVSRNDYRRAMAIVKRIVAMDPSAVNRRLEAELAVTMGDEQGAALAYLEIGHTEEDLGQDPSAAYERAYSLDMENPTAALSHARCLLRAGRAEQAVAVLQSQTLETVEFYEMYANALILTNRPEAAEPIVVKLYDHSTAMLPLVGATLAAHLRAGHANEATDFARTIEPKVRAQNGLREYLGMIRELVDSQTAGTDFLEYLAQVYNTANREHEYSDTLLKLFELYYAERSYMKAAECLERASEVDAYEPGHAERLELLRGKIDTSKFNEISNRLASVNRNPTDDDEDEESKQVEADPEPEKQQEPTILEDLMLQAEIFLQYSMRSKALERLERISKLFPHEEDKREKLAQLYTAAGYTPRYDDGTTAKSPGAAAANEAAVDNFAKVTDITRNIARQSTIKSVLFTTVNDVGRHWNVSRCVAGLSAPGKAPSAAMEYCAPGIAKSDVMGLAKLISTLQGQAVKAGGAVFYEEAEKAPELEVIRPVLAAQKIASLVAVPLKDGDEQLGIVVLEQCGSPRVFRKVDTVVLNTIAEQIVIAVNNARLRSLVKSLAPTDEKSGLLRRSSYLDVLLSETQRGLTQKSPITLVLMNFGSASALIKEVGEANVEAGMQEVGHAVNANIRQNDIAVRYGLTTIALILADTTDKNAFFALDKLRSATSNIRVPGRSDPLMMTAGIAELVMQPKFEAVDIVTEAINRVETALEIARHEGGNKAHAMAPVYETSAVTA
jgi:GGDEF domain-containing protein/tetratricopeptide (TPR) repeat protein